MQMNTEKMNFEINDFNGPLDLLLHLVKESKMDIYEVSIGMIVEQYISFIHNMEKMNIDIASEYLVMNAELIHLKSRMLLNLDEHEEEISEDEIKNEEELRQRLIEYQKYKQLSEDFKILESKRGEVLTKFPESLSEYRQEVELNTDTTLDDLLDAFSAFMERKKFSKPLSTKKERKHFIIHRCRNPKCSFYLNNLNALSKQDFAEYQSNPERFKLHYIYREFKIDFFKVDLHSLPKNASSLAFRKFSPHIMGLCLTYLVNCGMSTRAVSRVMREVHGVKISHTQIANYATTASYCIKPFVDSYDYKPTNYLAADETYTKVKGSKRYVWFIMDAIKKSILGYRSSDSRDVGPCILAMRMAFDKFKTFPGKALKFVADGFPAYLLARQQFALNKMDFDVTQVIGLTNDDEISSEYRWLKQIIERLNRTFKFSYKITNGYGSDDGASTHLVLFVAYYNFLRPHPYTYWKPLNEVKELEKAELMPAKWQILIELSQQIILSKQNP